MILRYLNAAFVCNNLLLTPSLRYLIKPSDMWELPWTILILYFQINIESFHLLLLKKKGLKIIKSSENLATWGFLCFLKIFLNFLFKFSEKYHWCFHWNFIEPEDCLGCIVILILILLIHEHTTSFHIYIYIYI